MDIRFCYYMAVIAEEQSLSRAAEKLFITQSALSQQLDKMEKTLGVALFKYEKNKMHLTESGEIFLKGAMKIIQIKESAYQKIANMSKHYTEHISIAMNRQSGSLLMSSCLPVFKKTYPDVKIDILEFDTAMARQSVITGAVDLALMGVSSWEKAHPQTEETFLYNEELVLIIPRQLPVSGFYNVPPENRPFVNWDDFKSEDFILSKQGTHIRMQVDKILRQNHVLPDIYCEINNFFAVRNMVEHGFGIAFLPESIAQESDSVISIHLNPPFYYRIVMVHHKTLVLSEPMEHLIDVIKEHCNAI